MVQSTIDSSGKEVLHPSHRIYKGPYKGPLYGKDFFLIIFFIKVNNFLGFELAELTTFPPSLLQSAREMAEKMRSDVLLHQLSRQNTDTLKQKKLAYIAHRILHIIPLLQDNNINKVKNFLLELRKRANDEKLP